MVEIFTSTGSVLLVRSGGTFRSARCPVVHEDLVEMTLAPEDYENAEFQSDRRFSSEMTSFSYLKIVGPLIQI